MNTLHPKQNPKNASRDAKNISTDIKNIAKLLSSRNRNRLEQELMKRPMDWANLLGGPGTNFSLKFKFGTIALVTINAKGLTFGPEEVLARNPYVKNREK